jgi:hypothetical protein
MTTNVFTDLAARQISAPRKARIRASEKRARTAEQRALAERDELHRLWKRYRREQLDKLLEGPFGDAARDLISFLKGMRLEEGAELRAFIERGPWREADIDTRFEIVRLIDASIVRLRERCGLEPFDDGLFDEPPTTFAIVKELLR